MIVKSENAKKREFKGVSFDVLAVGEKTMVTRMNFKMEDNVPFHKHPNEQNGYVVSGKYKIKFKDSEDVISSGDSYSIGEDVLHAFEVIEPGVVIDVFTPLRQDYL